MKLITILLQDELWAIIDEYLEELHMKSKSQGTYIYNLANDEPEEMKEHQEKDMKDVSAPQKNLKLEDYINSSTVIQYFAKKLNTYLKDTTFIVKKNALELGNLCLVYPI